jgi:hypothetical protein
VKITVADKAIRTNDFSDLMSKSKQECAVLAARMMNMIKAFHVESPYRSKTSQITSTVYRKPIMEIAIPDNASGMNFLLSYRTEQQRPVKLYPPIVKVVMSKLNSVSPKSPSRKTKIPISALILREMIIVIRSVFLK